MLTYYKDLCAILLDQTVVDQCDILIGVVQALVKSLNLIDKNKYNGQEGRLYSEETTKQEKIHC